MDMCSKAGVWWRREQRRNSTSSKYSRMLISVRRMERVADARYLALHATPRSDGFDLESIATSQCASVANPAATLISFLSNRLSRSKYSGSGPPLEAMCASSLGATQRSPPLNPPFIKFRYVIIGAGRSKTCALTKITTSSSGDDHDEKTFGYLCGHGGFAWPSGRRV